MPIAAAYAPVVPFERKDGTGVYQPLATLPAMVELLPPTAGPSSMGIQTPDVTVFTQAGQVWVQRGSNLLAGDRLTWSGRQYVVMGAANWDMNHPMTGYDFGWMSFDIQIDPAQLVADLLALRGQVITLIPAVGVVIDKPGGGKDYAPAAPRDPQTFVLFQVSSAHTGRLGKGFDAAHTADGGAVRTFQYNMIAAAGTEILIGDTWEDDIATYTVDSVDRTVPYAVGAVAIAFLKVQGHAFAG